MRTQFDAGVGEQLKWPESGASRMSVGPGSSQFSTSFSTGGRDTIHIVIHRPMKAVSNRERSVWEPTGLHSTSNSTPRTFTEAHIRPLTSDTATSIRDNHPL